MRILIATFFAVALGGVVALVPGAEQSPHADARTAIERSLDYIEREGFAWMDGRVPIQDGKGCVSCHHVTYGVWSLREAQRQGIARPETQVDLLERRAVTFVSSNDDCRAFSCMPLLVVRGGADDDSDLHGLAGQMMERQQDDGQWLARGQFPTQRRPIEESDAVATMWTMLAQGSLADEHAELLDSHAAAGRWLRDEDAGESTEWILLRWLVERRAGDAAAAEPFARLLVARQNEDGGWPWKADQASDAMTTGQVVYGLAVAGPSETSQESLQRAVSYLLSTQGADGTWVTASKLTSTEPRKAKDYIYTYWGTTWASIGLSRALDLPDVTSRAPAP